MCAGKGTVCPADSGGGDRREEGGNLGVTVNRSAQEARDPSASQILSHIAKSRERDTKKRRRVETNKRLTPY